MPTLLTTRRMSPELAARVNASVRGRRQAARSTRWSPSTTAWLRLGVACGIILATSSLLVWRARAQRELESQRAALLQQVQREARSLTDEEKAIGSRVESWIQRFTAAYQGDEVDAALQTEETLERTLGRPMLYVRGPVSGFADSPAIARSAQASSKDAFVACLLRPPASKTERELLAKVRAAYSRATQAEVLGGVQRLHHAIGGLPFLGATWQAHIRSAEDRIRLEKLKGLFEKAPIESAKRAAKSQLLLVALDEPGNPAIPAELDGERPHAVRVALVDLQSSRVLLRLRREVDPTGFSAKTRAEFATGIDGCRLALDVREAALGVRSAQR